MKIVSNSSPVILLSNVGRLDILKTLYNEIIIPEAVYKEIFEAQGKIEKPKWIKVKKVTDDRLVKIIMNRLGPGESEAIVLAIEIKADLLLLDDYQARIYANSVGLKITGIAGLIVGAKRKGIITNVKQILTTLIKFNYRISESLYNLIIKKADEEK